jgi:hypothetical protein
MFPQVFGCFVWLPLEFKVHTYSLPQIHYPL